MNAESLTYLSKLADINTAQLHFAVKPCFNI
jgi:hypothetical protein